MRFRERYEISSHDIDPNNNIRPSMILRYMEETADHQMKERKPSYMDLFRNGLSFVVTRMTVEIYEQLHEYDPIQAETWSCPGKGATFIRCYEIKRGGEVAAKAYSAWAVNDLKTGKICRTSDIDISSYESEEPLAMALPTRVRLPENALYEKVGERKVTYSDVDMNLHMTNTNYPNMLWDYIPDVKNSMVTSLNLRFMKGAPLGSTVKIYMARLPFPIKEDKRAEETYCFVTRIGEDTNVEAVFGTARLRNVK